MIWHRSRPPGFWFVWLGVVAVLFTVVPPNSVWTKGIVLTLAFGMAWLETQSIYRDRAIHDRELGKNRRGWRRDRKKADERHTEQLARFGAISQLIGKALTAEAERQHLLAKGNPASDAALVALANTASESWATVAQIYAQRQRNPAATIAESKASLVMPSIPSSGKPDA